MERLKNCTMEERDYKNDIHIDKETAKELEIISKHLFVPYLKEEKYLSEHAWYFTQEGIPTSPFPPYTKNSNGDLYYEETELGRIICKEGHELKAGDILIYQEYMEKDPLEKYVILEQEDIEAYKKGLWDQTISAIIVPKPEKD